ncbi:hypothetical protein [Wolbachia endosymbiont (group A) of Conops quadrifasciatus]|uniref:hypothetical protein n=1 Tax=Wolbachia endosymbiont (group A) of Conops quadrifasciatus TaxID=3066143 RepID=UPI003132F489
MFLHVIVTKAHFFTLLNLLILLLLLSHYFFNHLLQQAYTHFQAKAPYEKERFDLQKELAKVTRERDI